MSYLQARKRIFVLFTGVPAVLTDIGGAREMIIEGINGFLSASVDESLAGNWEKAIHTGFNPQIIHSITAGKFDSKLMIGEYKNILNEGS
jgi:glycosyltransferase involved in cell wall biosynthesis